MAERWVHPSPCLEAVAGAGAGPVLTPEQVMQWRTRGFCVVDGLWPAALVADTIAQLDQFDAESAGAPTSMLSQPTKAAAQYVTPLPARAADGGAQSPFEWGAAARGAISAPLEFPSVCGALNQVTLHERISTAVGQLLGTALDKPGELRLFCSQLLTRTGPPAGESSTPADLFTNGYGQRVHQDYPNNMMLAPPPWGRPEAVQCLLYLSEQRDAGGTTALIPRTAVAERGKDEAYAPDAAAAQLGGGKPFMCACSRIAPASPCTAAVRSSLTTDGSARRPQGRMTASRPRPWWRHGTRASPPSGSGSTPASRGSPTPRAPRCSTGSTPGTAGPAAARGPAAAACSLVTG
jgi:hypothetical protein